MQRMRSATGLAGLTVLVLLTALVPVAVAYAGVGDYSCSDPKKVYFGNHRLFRRPCTVSCDRVYQRIPEYQEILRRGLTDKDPHYHLLMKKATKRFTAAIKSMARSKNHDLVAEVGAVRRNKKKAPKIPDRTADALRALD